MHEGHDTTCVGREIERVHLIEDRNSFMVHQFVRRKKIDIDIFRVTFLLAGKPVLELLIPVVEDENPLSTRDPVPNRTPQRLAVHLQTKFRRQALKWKWGRIGLEPEGRLQEKRCQACNTLWISLSQE